MNGEAAYRFESIWRVPLHGREPAELADRAYEVLRNLDRYPEWWPQLRRVSPGGGREVAVVHVRSLVLLRLKVGVAPRRTDPVARVLAADVSGSLTGLCSWRVVHTDREVLVRFVEHADVSGPVLGKFALFVRPLLSVNHRLLMAGGRRGLRRTLD